jgi:ABC-type transport system involved in multi-copper enzyme maturation permease subunit
MLENPILRRELTATLRRRRTLVLAAVYLTGLAGIVGALWPTEGVYSLAAQATRSVVLVFTVTQLLLVMLYAPAFGATAITSEKEQNSYEVLFTTRLGPLAIAAGKLGATVTTLLLFVALSFPVFAVCFFLGAVSVTEALAIYGITVLTALLLGLLGLSVSAVKHTSHGALVTTYLLILLLNAGPWIPFFIFQHSPEAGPVIHLLRAVSPVAAIASVVVPAFDAGVAAWKVYTAFAGVTTVILWAVLVAAVRHGAREPVRAPAPITTDPKELARRKLRFPFYLIDPQRRRGHIPDWLNPIFAKELRAKAFGGGIWIFRAAYLCLAVSLALMAAVAGNLAMQSPDVIRTAAVVFQLGVIVLVVPSLTVGAVTQERERGNLDLLRQTRIGAGAFLTGKLLMAGLFVMVLVLSLAPLWFCIYFLKTNTLPQILIAGAVLGATVVLAAATGLFSSAVAGTTAAATGLAYGILAGLCVATLLPLLAVNNLSPAWRDAMLALNPFVTAIQGLATEFFGESRELWRTHVAFALSLSGLFLLIAALRVWRMLSPER